MRTLEELTAVADPAWPQLQGWFAEATNRVEVLPPSETRRVDALVGTQVTTRSILGSIVFETGGLLIDSGWLRVLGSGHSRLRRAIHEWNQQRFEPEQDASPGYHLIADDAVGGVFALNGGAFAGALGNVHYFAPDALEWEDMDMGYSDFVWWTLTGDLESYYEGSRWSGWQSEVAELSGDQGILVYPFLWADGAPVGERSRKLVPIEELVAMQFDLRRQLESNG